MAEPDWNPDTGGRSLAEILREAGIESADRAARRRSWDDPRRPASASVGPRRPPPIATATDAARATCPSTSPRRRCGI